VAVPFLLCQVGCTCRPGEAGVQSKGPGLPLRNLAWPLESARCLTDTLQRGESLFLSLTREGVPASYCWEMIEATRDVDHLSRNYPGEFYRLGLSERGVPMELRYVRLDGSVVVVRGPGEQFRAHRVEEEPEQMLMAAGGVVESSLYEAFVDAGLSAALVLQFADVFAWTVDFLTECRTGDTFRVVYTETAGSRVFEVLAVIYGQRDAAHVGLSLPGSNGRTEYYSPDGTNLRKAFLRSPLNYRRISSRFSHSRYHPILKIRRPHLGVDYAAPAGTPVVSVADGRVSYAGWKGGYGRYVEVKHTGGCYTAYGHLSRFGKGIKKGVRVAQGQVIGYVGSTGLSTGAHLDYRVRMQGRYVDPLRMDVPPAPPVSDDRMLEFRTRGTWLQIALAQSPHQGSLRLGAEWERWVWG
jgi:murein DD-endopeptidase MepM/ murein hydrolase activator NlpD